MFSLAIAWFNNCIANTIEGAELFCNPVADAFVGQDVVLNSCDPLEIVFSENSPIGSLFPAGICEGLIQAADMMAVVTE